MVPSYEHFFTPVMKALEAGPHRLETIALEASDALDLPAADRAEVVAYDSEPVVQARTRLALADLAKAGLVESVPNGFRLTSEGRSWSGPVSPSALEQVPSYAAYRARRLARRGA